MTQNKHVETKDSIQMREIKVRFVYEGEIKGEWINGLTAYENSFMVPNEGHKVIRLEFENDNSPRRIRKSTDESIY